MCEIAVERNELYPIQSQVFEGTPEMHVSGEEVVGVFRRGSEWLCLSSSVAVGPMRFSLCRRVVYC